MPKSKLHIPLTLALALVALAAGCRSVPITGRSQMLLTSEASENQAGDDAWRQINAQEPPGRSPDQKAAVSRVGQAIAKAADRPDYQWEFRLFESTQANAFCLPGGKIAVYSGIFQYMDDDAELAAVVGHEVGHAIARHGGERMSQQLLARAGAAGLSAGLGGANPTTAQLAMIAYGAGANVGAILPYSRAQEYEADHIGMILMAKAGYDPRATISFWEKFAKTSKDSPIAEFFSTHPMSAKRLEEMRHNLPAANSEYQMAPVKKGRGNPIRRLAKPPG